MTRSATRTDIENASLVLAKIATADQWAAKPDTAMAITWAECFAVHQLGRDDLLTAVIALYSDDTRDKANRTLPADVIRYARKIRGDRTEREKVQGAIDKTKLDAKRRAIAECALCDPNGWIDTAGGAVVRCMHLEQVTDGT